MERDIIEGHNPEQNLQAGVEIVSDGSELFPDVVEALGRLAQEVQPLEPDAKRRIFEQVKTEGKF